MTPLPLKPAHDLRLEPLPKVSSGLNVASTLSVIGAIVAEFTGADRGMGYLVVAASYRIDTRLMFAGIALSSAAGVLFFNFMSGLERLLLRWPAEGPRRSPGGASTEE